MSVVNMAVGYGVAWLVCGLGLFIAAASWRALRPRPIPAGAGSSEVRSWRPTQLLYVLPLAIALGLMAGGAYAVVLVVPW